MKITTQILLLIVLMGCSPTNPKGKGVCISKGTVKYGELINGRRFPKKGSNYKYFSKITYFLKNRAWVNAKVLDIAIEAYKECEITMPKRKFLLMECSHKKGGRMWPHRTHQNGTSIDFASPLKKMKSLIMAINGEVFFITQCNSTPLEDTKETRRFQLILKQWVNIF